VKKPKIKLNTSSTPKTANGAAAPAKEAPATKPPKQQKPKKSSEKKVEPKLTPEERHARKEVRRAWHNIFKQWTDNLNRKRSCTFATSFNAASLQAIPLLRRAT
jgi:hypothetical protein